MTDTTINPCPSCGEKCSTGYTAYLGLFRYTVYCKDQVNCKYASIGRSGTEREAIRLHNMMYFYAKKFNQALNA